MSMYSIETPRNKIYAWIAMVILGWEFSGYMGLVNYGCGAKMRESSYQPYELSPKEKQKYYWKPSWAGMIMPMKPTNNNKFVVTSEFGCRYLKRLHRSSCPGCPRGYNNKHRGIDIASNKHHPIIAPMDGVVEWSKWGSSCGNGFQIKHSDTLKTMYCHATHVFVKKGDQVKQGKVIATVGNTPGGFGDHLHFVVMVFLNGEWVKKNPREFLPLDFPEVKSLGGRKFREKDVQLKEALAKGYTKIEYGLGRMIRSETANPKKRVIIMYAAVNRFNLWNKWRVLKGKLATTMKRNLTCPRKKYDNDGDCPDWGDQRKDGRPYHTVRQPRYMDLALARIVLNGRVKDPTAKYGRATFWYEPGIMNKSAAERVHKRWCEDTYRIPSEYVGFTGDQSEKSSIRFYGEKRFLTESGLAKLEIRRQEYNGEQFVCFFAPKEGFTREDLKFPEVQLPK